MNGNDHIVDKLRKVLATTTSPVEAEAQTAAETLQRLLTEYNLEVADLEIKGTDRSNDNEYDRNS